MNSEAAVLGSCLVEAKAYWFVADLLTAEDFASGPYAALWRTISKLARERSAFDPVSIMELDSAQGDLAMTLASSDGWRAGNVRAYAEMVAKAAVARRVKQAGLRISHLEGDDVLGEAQRMLGLCVPKQSGAVRPLSEYLRESVAEMQRRVDLPDELNGVPTGIPMLDTMTSGWQPGDLIIVAARPSVGKTALAVQCAIAAAKAKYPTLVVSLEMSGTQLADRVQSHVAKVNANGFRAPKMLDESDFTRLFDAASTIPDLPIFIDQTTGQTVDSICARARQVHSVNKIGLLVIDYLTQIIPPKADTTANALQIITRTLKSLARELNIPLILLSQLNRDGEGHRPTMRTLRDSGAIEQDADIIAFLHREDPTRRDRILLIIEKQRNGEVGDIYLNANMAHMTFTQSANQEARVTGPNVHFGKPKVA